MAQPLSPRRARRFRIMFWTFLLAPFVAIAASFASPFEDASIPGVIYGSIFLTILVGGLLGLVLLQRHLLRVVNPEPEVRKKVLVQSWFGVIGNIFAVERLLQAGLAEHQRQGLSAHV